ncbi:MAG TPA: nitronate monooxygenase family protein [Acidimicrobiales bacterium]|nr:nitronate monooxygenase family protein [Acidimicrobiales bacterium]
MRTRLTDLLGVEHPVMLAGMGGVSYSALAAAVSNAGGYGCLGASTMSSGQLTLEITATKALTSKPFGVDLLTAFPDSLTSNVELLIEGGASTFVAGLGVPRHVIDLCHRNGVLVISMCGKVEHARRALDAGCDVVVAQGTEAGGHTGTVATFPLVPLIVDAVDGAIPVVAAGGVFDGRGLAAALALGADGVWIGTRFIATPEARALPGFRERILEAHEDDTVISRAYSGKTMRVIKNDTTARYELDPTLLKKFPDQLAVSVGEGTFHLGGDETTQGVDTRREGYPAGQAVGGIEELVPAGELVTRIVQQAESILSRLSSTTSTRSS